MRKTLIVMSVVVFIFLSLHIFNPFEILHIDNIVSSGSYSNIQSFGIKNGNMYITDGLNKSLFSYGSFATINKEEFDIDAFILDNNLQFVKVDTLSGQNLSLYILYSNKLSKHRLVNNKKYNLQIAINNQYVKIGYPAIFDSF